MLTVIEYSVLHTTTGVRILLRCNCSAYLERNSVLGCQNPTGRSYTRVEDARMWGPEESETSKKTRSLLRRSWHWHGCTLYFVLCTLF